MPRPRTCSAAGPDPAQVSTTAHHEHFVESPSTPRSWSSAAKAIGVNIGLKVEDRAPYKKGPFGNSDWLERPKTVDYATAGAERV